MLNSRYSRIIVVLYSICSESKLEGICGSLILLDSIVYDISVYDSNVYDSIVYDSSVYDSIV